jgi:hypothetical protein
MRSRTSRVKVVKAAPATKAQRKRLQAIRDKYQREKPTLDELIASGEYAEPLPQEEFWETAEAGRALKAARQQARVTLAVVAERSGIDAAALSRLENGIYDNPTLATLSRFARAVGKNLVFRLADVDEPRKKVGAKPAKKR